MKITIHSDGCKSCIKYLTLDKDTSFNNRRQLLTELFEDSDFSKWLEDYSSFVPEVRRTMFELMLNLDSPLPDVGPSSFFEKQHSGFLEAREMGQERMMQKLSRVEAIDYKGLEEIVDKYLPAETPLNLDIYFSIDKFNQGMLRETSVFLSVLTIDPETYSVRGLAHEVHHIGVLYWFKKNLKWQQWVSEENSPKRFGAELLCYIIGEGLANHLITPRAVSIIEERGNEREKSRNARIQMLEGNYPSLLASIEHMVRKALTKDLNTAYREFKEFSMDYSGVGLPSGHFTSAKMVAEILKERDQSIITDFLNDPWSFFTAYNNLTQKTYRFSKDFLDFYNN